MSAQSSKFTRNVLRTVAQITPMVIALACGDSTSPPVGAKYLVTASESSPIAGNPVVLKAQLVDADDRPLAMAGRAVIWVEGDTTIAGFDPVSSLTLADGSATTTFTTSTVAGRVHKISVSDGLGIKGSADVTTLTGPPAKYVVDPSTTHPEVGSAVIISAQLTDTNGNPSKTAGRVVTWSSTGPGGSFSSPTSTTNSDGIATVTFTIGTIGGAAYTVRVIDDNFAGGASAVFITSAAPIAKYVVSASVIDPPAGADIVIYAQAADAYGNPSPAEGRLVTWTNTGSGGSLLSSSTETDENGTATVTFKTGSVVGTTYTISGSDAAGFSGTSPDITTQSQVLLASIATGLGLASSCGIATDGKAWCWGANDLGGLGNGTTVDRSLPGKVSGNLSMTSLSAGASHSCGVTTSGVVQCWGDNSNGQLGDNTVTSRWTSEPIVSALTFTAVTAGDAHTCALASGGDVYCWGSNGNGRLGNGGLATSMQPVKVIGGLSFASISAGGTYTCGVTTGGDAYCWGSGGSGQLGNDSFNDRSTPGAVAGGFKFNSVSTGASHSCGIVVGGAAYCWGDNSHGQLGFAPPNAQAPYTQRPTPVVGGVSFIAISAGGFHTCGISTSQTAGCWGDNTTGELGNSTTISTWSPTGVTGGLRFKSISAGGGRVGIDDYNLNDYAVIEGHTCGVTTTGVTYCWGANNRGELGSGPLPAQSTAPRKVGGQP